MKLRFLLLMLLPFLALAAMACSGDDDDATPAASATISGTIVRSSPTSAPSPASTLGTAPAATPTPQISAEEQAKNLKLLEAPQGMLEFTTDGPYVVPGDALGVFYLNIKTQQIEGWYDLIGGTSPVAFSGENRFSVFQRSQQTFEGGQTYPAGDYLGDRGTQAVYRWDGDAELVYEKTGFNSSEISARGPLVLFRVPVAGDKDWFALLNVETNKVESTFQADGQWGLISRDGSKIALVGNGTSVVDVATGKVSESSDAAFDALTGPEETGEPGKISSLEMIESRDGGRFVVVATSVQSSGLQTGSGAIWASYDWNGRQLTSGQGTNAYASSDGEYVAVAEPIPGASDSQWYSLTAVSSEDSSPAFRVVGAGERFPEQAYNRWLADDSGLVFKGPGNAFWLAMRSGEIRDYIGVPSPTEPGVFAVVGGPAGSVGALNADGKAIVSINFQGGVRDFVDPWGDRGDELRMLIPHGGHDGPPAVATIVQPYVEEAPYGGEPQLQINDVGVAFGLLQLYETPGSDTVVGQVASPYRVTVQEVAWRCSGSTSVDPSQCQHIDSNAPHDFMALVLGAQIGPDAPVSSYWARVTTSDGQEGWLLLQANVQGI